MPPPGLSFLWHRASDPLRPLIKVPSRSYTNSPTQERGGVHGVQSRVLGGKWHFCYHFIGDAY